MKIKLALVFVAILTIVGLRFAPVSAEAPPGCYSELPNGSFQEATCKTAADTTNKNSGKCVVYTASSAGSSSSGSVRDCGSITTAGDVNNPPATGSSGGVSGGDESLNTDCEEEPMTADNCQIISYIVDAINFLSAVAMLSIIFSLVIAGYMYMTARDNAGRIEQAKRRIYWTFASLGIFLFAYAFLQWLVPGGVLP